MKKIEKFLDENKIKYDIKAYRGDGSYWAFNPIKVDNNKTLKEAVEEFTDGIESGKYSVQQTYQIQQGVRATMKILLGVKSNFTLKMRQY